MACGSVLCTGLPDRGGHLTDQCRVCFAFGGQLVDAYATTGGYSLEDTNFHERSGGSENEELNASVVSQMPPKPRGKEMESDSQ